jgi:AAA15 family ATPase/GTPase
MLKEIYIDNYRRFLNTKINFGKTVLIAGKNGTGKTSFVALLEKIKRFIVNTDSTGHIAELVSVNDVPRWQKADRGTAETHFMLTFKINEAIYVYELKIQYNLTESKCRILCEKLSIAGAVAYDFMLEKNENEAVVITDDHRQFSYGVDWSHSGLGIASRVNSNIRQFIAEINTHLCVFILAPDALDAPDYKTNRADTTELLSSGGNFSHWYATMLTRNIEVAADVLASYKDFIKNIDRAFINDKTGEFTISEKSEGKQKFEIGFSELSTGQQKLCIYYALFKMLPDGATLVFDEFENHLSPAELQPLYDIAQHEQDERDLQIILVSHHHKTLNWYHDAALVFSLSGMPAHSKTDAFNPDSVGATLEQYLEDEQ